MADPIGVTVFVLGAGVSYPYGFPLGQDLVESIIQLDRDKFVENTAGRYPPDMVKGLQNALLRSGMRSIDRFLENRSDYLDVGKAAIASVLMPLEIEELMYSGDRQRTGIYSYLYNDIIAPKRADDVSHRGLAFITYNYDRSLEHFLFQSLRHSFGLSKEAAAGCVSRVPIFHVHGSLGSLPGVAANGPERPYKPTIAGLNEAAQRLRIVSEDIDRSHVLVHAHGYLAIAARVIFLGFSYDETNVRRLNLQSLLIRSIDSDAPRNPTILGTKLGITNGERFARVDHLFDRLPVALIDKDCLALLRDEFWNSGYRPSTATPPLIRA